MSLHKSPIDLNAQMLHKVEILLALSSNILSNLVYQLLRAGMYCENMYNVQLIKVC